MSGLHSMASLARLTLRPQCSACTRQITRLGLVEAWSPVQQQMRSISKAAKTKAAKEEERNVTVKLLKDMPRWGRAGTLVTLNRSRMRNRWFPQRLADYVPVAQLKQLKKEGVTIGRDTEFGVVRPLQEDFDVDNELEQQRKHYVRPVEVDFLSPTRSMELLTTFIPPTIDFAREAIEEDKTAGDKKRYGASDAADILTAAMMSSKPKSTATAIYGSVSTTDIVMTIKSALAHNDEAARVVLSDNDVKFVAGVEDGDSTRVKHLGTFKIEIQVPGAEAPITRTVRVRARQTQTG